jgi:RNA polymerase sigma-70 factor (ECF subfamily)
MQNRIKNQETAQNEHLNAFDSSQFDSNIYSKFYKPIFNYVRKHISYLPVAQEVTQDIFLKIYQNRESYDPNFAMSSWIWTIAKNTIFDHLRKLRSSFPNPIQSLDELCMKNCFEPSSEITAETLIIEKTDQNQLKLMIGYLSKRQREAIFLRLVKRFSYREISGAMNLSLSAVKSLINRGKTTLVSISQNEGQQKLENHLSKL